nr:hypothetical protein MIMGU_mgv11b018721mg [Ipomoea batatas]
MKFLAVVSIVAFIVCCSEVIMTTNTVVASNGGLPFHINPRTLEQSADYISITGCSNDCDIACCYCEIRQQPPLCLQCCKERN